MGVFVNINARPLRYNAQLRMNRPSFTSLSILSTCRREEALDVLECFESTTDLHGFTPCVMVSWNMPGEGKEEGMAFQGQVRSNNVMWWWTFKLDR